MAKKEDSKFIKTFPLYTWELLEKTYDPEQDIVNILKKKWKKKD